MRFWPLAIVGTLVISWCLIYKTPTKVAVDDGSWNYRFVTALGNPKPSPEILQFMEAWHRAEGGTAAFNPLNTTMPMAGDSCYNYLSGSCGVRNYQSEQDGFDANIATITNGRYGTLLRAIQTNDVSLALQGLKESPWGTDADTVSAVLATMPLPVSEQGASVLQRQALVEYALSLQGAPYIVGGGTSAFRAGELEAGSGDCSSTIQHIYMHVLGIDIGRSTFTQFTDGFTRGGKFYGPSTVPISIAELQPGDLWYGSYPDDEHVAMFVGDVTGDGTLDFIDEGGKKQYMGIDNDALNDPYFMDHTVGYARMIQE